MENEVGCWTTKGGTVIKIIDMDDNHLINSIRFLKRTVGRMRLSRELAGYSALNFIQGEMAEISIENDLLLDASLDDEEWLEQNTPYKELIEEAKRRDILMFVGANIFSGLWKPYVETFRRC